MSPASNKIALFIDGANLYATAKTLGFDIDYKRLLKEFQSRGTLLRAFYYTAIIEDQEYSSIRPLIDWLDYNGYTVVTKATKEFIDASGRRKVKGNMDIELAVDAMELAEHVDQIVLFSGDGDFRSLVEAVQRRGVRVTVVSTISSQPPMIADELRRQADVFTDLVELQSKLGRDPSERPAPREPRHHAPQFLQRATTMAPRAGDDDFDDVSAARCRCRPPNPTAIARSVRGWPTFARKRARASRTGSIHRFPPSATPRRKASDRRAGARHAGRQSHRAALHRRLRRRPALCHLARIRLCQGRLSGAA